MDPPSGQDHNYAHQGYCVPLPHDTALLAAGATVNTGMLKKLAERDKSTISSAARELSCQLGLLWLIGGWGNSSAARKRR